jgi:hypothetical protein
MAKKRIFVTVNDNDLKIIIQLMKAEKRSQAYVASMIFQDGLKLIK